MGSPRWSKVQAAVDRGNGPFLTLHKLAQQTSFERHQRAVREGPLPAPLLRHAGSVAPVADPMRSAGSTMRRQQSAAAAMAGHFEAAADMRQLAGFKLEYVIQMVAPGQGPHVCEVQMSSAKLRWPYLTDLEWVTKVAETYSHCCRPAWVSPFVVVSDCLFQQERPDDM